LRQRVEGSCRDAIHSPGLVLERWRETPVSKDVQEALRARGKALEEAFFRKEGERLRELQRLRHDEESAIQGLRDASGIEDDAILKRLSGLGVRAETLAALTLIPLVEVAWADDRMEKQEREAVLAGAESTGIVVGSPSHALLKLWLDDRPAPDLFAAWREFIRALCAQLSADERLRLRENVVGRARRVAEAAGGFLNLGDPVSKVESAVLEDLAGLF
jgi:hypothetical protein